MSDRQQDVEVMLKVVLRVPEDWELIEDMDGVPYYFEGPDGEEIHPLIALDFDAQSETGRMYSTDAGLHEIGVTISDYRTIEVRRLQSAEE